MSPYDFWQLIYAAAINNNHSNVVALGIANEAIGHMKDRWPAE